MMFKEYIKDKILFLIINIFLFSLVFMALSYIGTSITIIFLIFCIWFLPLGIYIIVEYLKFRKYCTNIYSLLDNLDKKYLLPELIKESNYFEGNFISDVLKIVSRDMHENINFYKNQENDYREYIETWVHEIKTPIASSKLIIENNKDEVTKKINTQLERIEIFVEQVLYYSKINEVSKDYIIKEVDLSKIVNSCIKRNYRDFINKKIKLELDEINETIYTDSKWIEFIINQILINAIKYSKSKNSKIKIYSLVNENSITLNIEDNGVGIPENDIESIFDKGFTGENGRRFGNSTGIGLYLCKRLSNKLGINILAYSKLDIGTRISIVFPKDMSFIL